MAFLFRLETEDGAPAEPSSLASAVPNWRSEDEIPLGHRTLRVVHVRDDDSDQPPVLIVEDVAESATGVPLSLSAGASKGTSAVAANSLNSRARSGGLGGFHRVA
jgi:hypothetical protein